MKLAQRLQFAVRNPIVAFRIALSRVLRHGRPADAPSHSQSADLQEIVAFARRRREAISDHLATLFIESVVVSPKLIVELGVRDGDSTFAFERVARLCDAHLVSVDLFPRVRPAGYALSWFVQEDDVSFAGRFQQYCADIGIEALVDVLFIDTSHEFEHTQREIAAWFPHLSQRAKVLFHDTNMGRVHARKDGTLTGGWDNKRGVIRAIEQHLDARFNERETFVDLRRGWLIRHDPFSGGFTVLERLPPDSNGLVGAA